MYIATSLENKAKKNKKKKPTKTKHINIKSIYALWFCFYDVPEPAKHRCRLCRSGRRQEGLSGVWTISCIFIWVVVMWADTHVKNSSATHKICTLHSELFLNKKVKINLKKNNDWQFSSPEQGYWFSIERNLKLSK